MLEGGKQGVNGRCPVKTHGIDKVTPMKLNQERRPIDASRPSQSIPTRDGRHLLLVVLCLSGLGGLAARRVAAQEPASTTSPSEVARQDAVRKGLSYLREEVPRWRKENGCFSCHNNGDGARALIRAHRIGKPFEAEGWRQTLDWLNHPERWRDNGGESFSDHELATLQFSIAYAEARHAQQITRADADNRILSGLESLQRDDGSWPGSSRATIGGPLTYGNELATALSIRALSQLSRETPRASIERGRRFLRQLESKNTPQAAAILIGLSSGEPNSTQKAALVRAWQFLRAGQHKTGGFGPFPGSYPEPYDTALALIALQEARPYLADSATGHDPLRTTMLRAQSWLIEAQLEDGGWTETTRPANNESYAHHISTTAWSLMALLATP